MEKQNKNSIPDLSGKTQKDKKENSTLIIKNKCSRGFIFGNIWALLNIIIGTVISVFQILMIFNTLDSIKKEIGCYIIAFFLPLIGIFLIVLGFGIFYRKKWAFYFLMMEFGFILSMIIIFPIIRNYTYTSLYGKNLWDLFLYTLLEVLIYVLITYILFLYLF